MHQKFCLALLICLLSISSGAQVVCRFSVSDSIGCTPLTVHFNDVSSGSPVSWHWNFGNGDTSLSQNPSMIFVDTGLYTVTLRASNDTSSDSATLNIRVFPLPVVNFVASSTFAQCPPFPVQFTNTSIDTGIIHFWEFGSGDTASVSNPYYVYEYPGSYDVSLKITDKHGCINSKTDSALILVRGPIGNFTSSILYDSCSTTTVIFSGTETSVASSVFTTGDGDSFLDTINVTYTYTVPGTFYPVIILRDSFGCTISYKVNPGQINVFGLASPNESIISDSCSHATVVFTGTEISAASFVFVTGDGRSFADTTNLTYTYTSPGIFYPVFTLTDSFGCTVSYPADSIEVLGCDTSDVKMIEPSDIAFRVFPNPVSDVLKIQGLFPKNYKFEFCDLTGKKLIEGLGNSETLINTSGFVSGMYLLKLYYPGVNQFYEQKPVIIY